MNKKNIKKNLSKIFNFHNIGKGNILYGRVFVMLDCRTGASTIKQERSNKLLPFTVNYLIPKEFDMGFEFLELTPFVMLGWSM